MKQAFDLFDKNHDGRISSDELGRVLRTLGHDHSQEEVEDMIKTADTNGESKPLMGSIKYITLVLMSRQETGSDFAVELLLYRIFMLSNQSPCSLLSILTASSSYQYYLGCLMVNNLTIRTTLRILTWFVLPNKLFFSLKENFLIFYHYFFLIPNIFIQGSYSKGGWYSLKWPRPSIHLKNDCAITVCIGQLIVWLALITVITCTRSPHDRKVIGIS